VIVIDTTGQRPKITGRLGKRTPIKRRNGTFLIVEMKEPFEVMDRDGKMTGNPSDYLIIDQNKDHYPCERAIFEGCYLKGAPNE
jgi:hypothetical protein